MILNALINTIVYIYNISFLIAYLVASVAQVRGADFGSENVILCVTREEFPLILQSLGDGLVIENVSLTSVK